MKIKENVQDWVQFLAGLEVISEERDKEMATLFRRKSRMQIALVCSWLEDLQITGRERHIAFGAPSECDFCGADLLDDGVYVDGQVTDGSWGNMCMTCLEKHGSGIGWGVGQLYKHKGQMPDGDPLWVCIAGGAYKDDFSNDDD